MQRKPRGSNKGAGCLRTKGKVKTCHREDRTPPWTRFPSLPFKGHPSAALIPCVCWTLPALTNQDVPAAAGSARDLKVGSQRGGGKNKQKTKQTTNPTHPGFSRLHLCFKLAKEEAAPRALTWLRGDGYIPQRVPAGRAPTLGDPLFPPGRTPAPAPTGQLYHQPTSASLPSTQCLVGTSQTLAQAFSFLQEFYIGRNRACTGRRCLAHVWGVLHCCPAAPGTLTSNSHCPSHLHTVLLVVPVVTACWKCAASPALSLHCSLHSRHLKQL